MDTSILCFSTYAAKIKECDALESYRTIALVELTKNVVDSASHKVLPAHHRSRVDTTVGSLVGWRHLVEAVTRLETSASEMPSLITINALPISGVLH
jgi:hypothetical protein